MKNWIIILLIPFMFSCNENNEEEINITVCGETNPTWLMDTIHDILNSTSNFRPIEVYSIENSDVEYVAITDFANSSLDKNIMFYTCSGVKIELTHEIYAELMDLYNTKKFYLLWSN